MRASLTLAVFLTASTPAFAQLATDGLRTASANKVSGDVVILSQGQIACQSWDTVEAVIKDIVRKDMEAYKLRLMQAAGKGDCTYIDAGSGVMITKRGFASMRIRLPGSLTEYWIAF